MDAPDPTAATADAVAERLMPTLGSVRRRLRRVAGPVFADSVSPAQRETLVMVAKRPGSAVAEIAQELGLAPNSVSTMVTQLVGGGHLVRTTDPGDRRVGRLTLTPLAAAESATVRDRRRAVLRAALARLGPDQVAALAAGVDALTALAAQLQVLEQASEPVPSPPQEAAR